MSKMKNNPLEVSSELLEEVFGGAGSYDAGVSNCTAMRAKCAHYEYGSNNYIGMTLRNTCGQCKYFRYSKTSGRCLFSDF